MPGPRAGNLGRMTEEPVDEPGAEESSPDVVTDLEHTIDETEQIQTGISAVDSVVDDVARLVGRPVEEHAAVFESAHERLRRTLDDPDAVVEQPGPSLDAGPDHDQEP